MITKITREELQQKLEHPKRSVVLDVLSPEDYRLAHIPGALNLPRDQVRTLASDLVARKDLEVIVYSAGPACHASENVADQLTAMGYTDVRHYAGGKSDWLQSGLPVASEEARNNANAEEIETMPANKPMTKILLDGGDPDETQRIRDRLGFLDGQTTNPTLVATNPDVQGRIVSGHRLSIGEQKEEYKRIVQKISPLIGSGGVSLEVFADFNTTAEQMVSQGEEMYSWIPNACIKYPCIPEGLRAAKISVERDMRVNMTLCFSQAQAAAVYAATKSSKQPVYVSPFVGRLDDRGDDGMQVVRNIKEMYRQGDGHVHVLVASVRKMDHLLYAFALSAELATVPAKILEEWAAGKLAVPGKDFVYRPLGKNGKPLRPVPYQQLDLNASWETFDLKHELTDKEIRKFVDDYRSTLAPAA